MLHKHLDAYVFFSKKKSFYNKKGKKKMIGVPYSDYTKQVSNVFYIRDTFAEETKIKINQWRTNVVALLKEYNVTEDDAGIYFATLRKGDPNYTRNILRKSFRENAFHLFYGVIPVSGGTTKIYDKDIIEKGDIFKDPIGFIPASAELGKVAFANFIKLDSVEFNEPTIKIDHTVDVILNNTDNILSYVYKTLSQDVAKEEEEEEVIGGAKTTLHSVALRKRKASEEGSLEGVKKKRQKTREFAKIQGNQAMKDARFYFLSTHFKPKHQAAKTDASIFSKNVTLTVSVTDNLEFLPTNESTCTPTEQRINPDKNVSINVQSVVFLPQQVICLSKIKYLSTHILMKSLISMELLKHTYTKYLTEPIRRYPLKSGQVNTEFNKFKNIKYSINPYSNTYDDNYIESTVPVIDADFFNTMFSLISPNMMGYSVYDIVSQFEIYCITMKNIYFDKASSSFYTAVINRLTILTKSILNVVDRSLAIPEFTPEIDPKLSNYGITFMGISPSERLFYFTVTNFNICDNKKISPGDTSQYIIKKLNPKANSKVVECKEECKEDAICDETSGDCVPFGIYKKSIDMSINAEVTKRHIYKCDISRFKLLRNLYKLKLFYITSERALKNLINKTAASDGDPEYIEELSEETEKPEAVIKFNEIVKNKLNIIKNIGEIIKYAKSFNSVFKVVDGNLFFVNFPDFKLDGGPGIKIFAKVRPNERDILKFIDDNFLLDKSNKYSRKPDAYDQFEFENTILDQALDDVEGGDVGLLVTKDICPPRASIVYGVKEPPAGSRAITGSATRLIPVPFGKHIQGVKIVFPIYKDASMMIKKAILSNPVRIANDLLGRGNYVTRGQRVSPNIDAIRDLDAYNKNMFYINIMRFYIAFMKPPDEIEGEEAMGRKSYKKGIDASSCEERKVTYGKFTTKEEAKEVFKLYNKEYVGLFFKAEPFRFDEGCDQIHFIYDQVVKGNAIIPNDGLNHQVILSKNKIDETSYNAKAEEKRKTISDKMEEMDKYKIRKLTKEYYKIKKYNLEEKKRK
jgi:hypothetical protein